MATATTKVYIGGVELLPYNIHVDQRSDWHHRFEITVSTEKANVLGGAMKGAESMIIDNAITYVGEVAEITIERHNGSFTFKGIITDVQIDHTYAGDGFIIFRGYAPTYLLDGQISVQSFEEQSLTDIFNAETGNLPGNIKKEVNPKYSDAIPYVVRYKETQYQFLSRLAATYGEWFFYDGQQIVFGDLPGGGSAVELTFGSDSMLSFNYGINVRPSGFKQQFYKYEDNATLEKSVAGFKPGWLDSHSKTSLKTSDELFTEEGIDPVTHRVKDTNHLNYLAEAKKSSIVGDVMIFSGQSANPAVAIGAEIEVSSRNGFIGKYRVIAVAHNFNSNRDYYNLFRAIPSTTLSPPLNKAVTMPQAEPQKGVVTDNNDPDKLGRVRVKLNWQEGETPWIRVMTNHAGEDRGEGVYGTYFIPEIGDEVMVEFEQGNPARPYVSGSHYHGSIAPEYANADNNLKAIKTRSGHKLVFDDKDGKESILISDKNGNLIKVQTDGDNIYVKAGTAIYIEAGDSVNIDAGSTVNIKAGDTINLGASNINLVGTSTVNISAAGSYNLVAGNKMDVVSSNTMIQTKNLTTLVGDKLNTSAKNIFQSAKDSIETKAKKEIKISADKELVQRAGKVKLSSKKGKIQVNAKTTAEIKGKQVKNN